MRGEAKTRHGLARAVRRWLWNMCIQAYLTPVAINLKRPATFTIAFLLSAFRYVKRRWSRSNFLFGPMPISAILSLMQCPLFLSLGAFALFASGFAGAGEAISDNPGSERKIPEDRWRGAWSFQVENDKIANTDRHYTNGVRISWVSDRRNDGPHWTRKLLEKFYPLASPKGAGAGLAIGHNIYTPTDTNATTLVANDRPYAGWIYVETSLHAAVLNRDFFGVAADTLDSVALNIGWVGSAAHGEEVQNNFHNLIGVSRSLGWKNQLDNEPTLALMVERKFRPAPVILGPVEFGTVPFMGASLGNSFTLATLGNSFRLGRNIDHDYGPPLIRPVFSGLAGLDRVDDFGWYVFAGVEARAVAHNIFLDGNTFTDSHSVDKKTWNHDLQLGAAITYKGVRAAITLVRRSKEFEGQDKPDKYGVVSISKHF